MKTRPITPARVVFKPGDPPSSPTYGDLYHPRSGAGRQAREVFLAGNGLPERWRGRERFTVLETGFGLGNNLLATWQAWRDDPARCGTLHLVSIEAHPLTQADLAQAHAASEWPELSRQLLRQWPPLTPGLHRVSFEQGRVQLLLALGDARQMLPSLNLVADAVFLDGFAPDRNPAMWDAHLLQALAHRCAADATLATWSVAGELRRRLSGAGFEVQKHPGSGGKREVLRARLKPPVATRRPPPRLPVARPRALVIGAGLAGAWASDALRREGWQVTVLERQPAPALETSGNPAGIFHGVVHGEDGVHSRLFRAAARVAQQVLAPWVETGAVRGQVRGLLRLSDEPIDTMRSMLVAQGLPPATVQALARDEAAHLAGCAVPGPAWLFPGGGWVATGDLVRCLLAQPGIRWVGQAWVASLRREGDEWVALNPEGAALGQAPVLVLANARGAAGLAAAVAEAGWPLREQPAELLTLPARPGQPSQQPHATGEALPVIPLAGGGYLVARPEGGCWAGGGLPARLLGPLGEPIDRRHGQRLQTPDRLPIVGPLAQRADELLPGTRRDQARLLPRCPGLFALTALGSRGLTLAPLAGQLLAAQITGAPLPVEQDLVDALDPGRFLVKAARKQRPPSDGSPSAPG